MDWYIIGVIMGFLLGFFTTSYLADRVIEKKAEQKDCIEIDGERYRVVKEDK
jgi:prolipoprotein diacylglyceryltransferase